MATPSRSCRRAESFQRIQKSNEWQRRRMAGHPEASLRTGGGRAATYGPSEFLSGLRASGMNTGPYPIPSPIRCFSEFVGSPLMRPRLPMPRPIWRAQSRPDRERSMDRQRQLGPIDRVLRLPVRSGGGEVEREIWQNDDHALLCDDERAVAEQRRVQEGCPYELRSVASAKADHYQARGRLAPRNHRACRVRGASRPRAMRIRDRHELRHPLGLGPPPSRSAHERKEESCAQDTTLSGSRWSPSCWQ